MIHSQIRFILFWTCFLMMGGILVGALLSREIFFIGFLGTLIFASSLYLEVSPLDIWNLFK